MSEKEREKVLTLKYFTSLDNSTPTLPFHYCIVLFQGILPHLTLEQTTVLAPYFSKERTDHK